jgi:sorbitol-specific phosphotransferase system component IIC
MRAESSDEYDMHWDTTVEYFQTAWHVVDMKATLWVARLVLFMSPLNELSNFLTQVKNQKCKDNRDRIYALPVLALFNLTEPATLGSVASSITPDYSKSTSKVYTNVARSYILQGDLFILH